MSWSGLRSFAPMLLFILVAACQDESRPGPAEPPVLAARAGSTCNLRDITKAARGYFPGKGQNSILSQVQDLVDLMEADCQDTDQAAYTSHWFDVATIVQGVLETGAGGSVADGTDFLVGTLNVLAPDGTTLMFDPCGGDADCLPWEGFPTAPDFASVLSSSKGAWAIVSTGTDAVCSSFQYPCAGLDPAITGDDWGAEPSVNWELALHGRTTLVFGAPLPGPSPTGEPLLNTELPAYQWLMIPDPVEFGVDLTPQAVLEVGLCSTATSQIDEILVQKGKTVLTEAVIDFCTNQLQSLARSSTPGFGRLVSVLGSLFSPVPAPLIASVVLVGPGGSAGSFTDFYAIDLPREALILIPSQPVNGTVGQPLLGADGEEFSVKAVTSSMASPLENALITIEIIGNGGLIPSGNGVSGADVTCDGFVCTGRTQADEDAAPGELPLGLLFTKPGSYTLCFSASLPPLSFSNAVCSDKFVINP